MQFFDSIALAVGISGVIIIVWGALRTFLSFLVLEYQRFHRVNILERSEFLRHSFGTYLLLGLEFLVAADIIHTIIQPDVEGLIVLGSIVAIRTVISYFLNRELDRRPPLRENK